MIIDNVDVVVKITGQNKKGYNERLNANFKNGDIIKISQKDLAPTTKKLVWCECDICNIVFTREFRSIRQHKRSSNAPTICGSIKCKSELGKRVGSNPEKPQIKVNCHVCKTDKMVEEAVYKRNNFHFCSRDCYGAHKTGVLYEGRKLRCPNFIAQCEICQDKFNVAEIGFGKDVRYFCSNSCLEHAKDGKKTARFKYHINKNGGRKETPAERTVREYLEKDGIEFISEYSIDEVYFADFYFPDHNTILEVYGDYWHVNPDIYDKSKRLHVKQIQKLKADTNRNTYIEACGYNLKYLWERDINNDFETVIGTVLNSIKNQTKILND